MGIESLESSVQAESKNPNKKLIIFVGPEGSGKTRQAKLLSSQMQIPYISTGDIIRERAKNDEGRLGEACRVMLEKRTYLSPELLQELVIERLKGDDVKDGVVFDGALRTLGEVENFDETLQEAGRSDFSVNVVYLRVPGWAGADRILKDKEDRGARTDGDVGGILSRMGHFYDNLSGRMSLVRGKYNFSIVDSLHGNIEEVNKQVRDVLGIYE